MKFINNLFKKNVSKVINLIFPNLINDHKILLNKYTLQIIEYISCRFCFDLNNIKQYRNLKGYYY